MNIKFKLTFWFTSIVAAILFGSFLIVYENYSFFRQANFYDRLEDRAHVITNAYLDSRGLDEKTIRTLNEYALSISPNLRVTLYTADGRLLQPIGSQIEITPQIINDLKKKSPIEAQINDTQYIFFSTHHKTGDIIALSSAYDKTGFSKVAFLRKLFILILFLAIMTTAIVGWLFSRYSLRPMNEVVNDAQLITASNLHKRLTVQNERDEIGNLSTTFNKMLDRLESAFNLQKEFVSNASHEFRTPLTSMKGQIQVALLRARSNEDYKSILHSLNEDIDNLINLLNSLHELAKANANVPLNEFKLVPILDILMDAQNDLLKGKPHYKIEISVDNSIDQPEKLNCLGDVNLLKSAFANIIDNGCKFSVSHTVSVLVAYDNEETILTFTDYGPGIAPENLELIFEPFFRTNETRNIQGHGIGLSLVKRILEWHKGKIEIHSKLKHGTSIIITLPSIKS